MIVPSSSPLIFDSGYDDSIEKHMAGKHDQSFHAGGGRSAAYARMALNRKKMMDSGKIKHGMKRDNRGNVINPDATGGYKAGIPNDIEFDGMHLTPDHSLWHHLESDGANGYRLTAERAALHNSIIEKATAGIPSSDNPTFTMLGGGPAAGKTTALKQGIVEGVPSKTQGVHINADDLKDNLPEYGRMTKSDDDNDFFEAAAFSHEESSMLAKRVQNAAVANKQDIVLDGTGDSSMEKLEKKIKQATSAGYGVQGVYFTIPTEEAWGRSKKRALNSSGRRFVPEYIVRDTHKQVSNTFKEAAVSKAFTRLILIDSTVMGGAKIIGQTDNSRNFVAADQAAYDEFLAKGNE